MLHHRVTRAILLLTALLIVPVLRAQEPAFDAVSIKRHVGGRGGGFTPSGAGRFRATDINFDQIIGAAWAVPMGLAFGIKGMPRWMIEEAYDLEMVWPPETPADQVRVMFQRMFADRLKLVVHYETIDDPSYALTLARADGRLGPEMKRSAVDCDALSAAMRAGNLPQDLPNGAGPCAMKMSGDGIVSGGIPMSQFAANLTGPSGRQVVDRTGLDGRWEFTLQFSREERDPNAPLGKYPSVADALREQLGLKLVPFVAKNRLLVIDHIERPTEN